MTTTPEQLHDVRFPGESDEYRRAREDLLRAELELREHTEAVAEQRRRLPLGGAVPCDYEFREWDTRTGGPRGVKLSQLFEGDRDTLFLPASCSDRAPTETRSDRRALLARRSSMRSRGNPVTSLST